MCFQFAWFNRDFRFHISFARDGLKWMRTSRFIRFLCQYIFHLLTCFCFMIDPSNSPKHHKCNPDFSGATIKKLNKQTNEVESIEYVDLRYMPNISDQQLVDSSITHHTDKDDEDVKTITILDIQNHPDLIGQSLDLNIEALRDTEAARIESSIWKDVYTLTFEQHGAFLLSILTDRFCVFNCRDRDTNDMYEKRINICCLPYQSV